jgi:hypothetical protein
MCSGLEDTVVVDGGDVRARSGFGLGLEKTWREEERSGLRTEDAAGSCHGLPEEYHEGLRDVSLLI